MMSQAMAECYRVLKPGDGYLSATMTHRKDLKWSDIMAEGICPRCVRQGVIHRPAEII